MTVLRSIPFVALPFLPLLFGARHTPVPGAPLSVAPELAPARSALVGRIAGKVEVSSALATRRPRFRIYSDVGPGAVPPAPPRAQDDIARELRNVVVYVESAPVADVGQVVLSGDTGAGRDSASPAMSQTDERFEPHVLPVVRGARVSFPNHDDVYHNVFSLSSTRTFDLGRYPKGDARAVAFEKPGVVRVFCHIHSDMNGVVLVLSNPHFAAPEASGRYVIDNVPPGEYTVVGWHERTRPVSHKVRVVAGETSTLNFSLPLGPSPRGEP